MRNFRDCIIIAAIFFLAALTLLEVDRRCADMYHEGGRLEEAAVRAVSMMGS